MAQDSWITDIQALRIFYIIGMLSSLVLKMFWPTIVDPPGKQGQKLRGS